MRTLGQVIPYKFGEFINFAQLLGLGTNVTALSDLGERGFIVDDTSLMTQFWQIAIEK